jgi:hypothetical protein
MIQQPFRRACLIGSLAVIVTALSSLRAQPATTSTTTAPAPASASPNPILASVGNTTLQREDFTSILISVGGMKVFDEFWGYAVVVQALESAGLTITPEDIQSVKEQIASKTVFAGGPAITALDKDTKDKAIYKLLADRGIATVPQIDWYLGTYAGLKILGEKVARDQITPTPAELDSVDRNTFGDRATLVDFSLKDEKEAAEVIKSLAIDRLEVVARNHTAQRVVITKDDRNIPAEIQQEIWKNLGPGKFSDAPIKDKRSGVYHVLYVIVTEAARTPAEDEKNRAHQAFADQKAQNWRAGHLLKLKMMAIKSIRINDPILQSEFNAMLAQLRSAMAAAGGRNDAALTPATAPSAAPQSPNPIIASIRNTSLRRDDLANILLAIGGLRIFDEYWGYAVVMQNLETSGLKLTPENIQDAKDQIAAKIPLPAGGTAVSLDKVAKDQAVAKFLAERGMAHNKEVEWYLGTVAGLQLLAQKIPDPNDINTEQKLSLWRNTYLNALKLASLDKVQINDPLLQAQFKAMTDSLRKK